MKIAIDVHYKEEIAKIVAVVFSDWHTEDADDFLIKYLEVSEAYVPGQFYKRELPCILEILKAVNLDEVDCIIIDGFVYLDDDGKKGLGAILYDELGGKIPVIGVAKSNFHQNTKNNRAVMRGESTKPLYITSEGVDLNEAARVITEMGGTFRMPTLLQQLDTKTKEL